jgi:hypothetical protein
MQVYGTRSKLWLTCTLMAWDSRSVAILVGFGLANPLYTQRRLVDLDFERGSKETIGKTYAMNEMIGLEHS